MRNKYIYLVTPDYMLAVIEESKGYSFSIKGYPNAKVAYDKLALTNQSSILGYLLVYEELPEILNDIVDFINFLNLIGTKDTVVLLAVNDPSGLEDVLLPALKYNNITFMYFTDFEVMTDMVIRKNLFGSIIIKKFNPYNETVDLPKFVTSFNSNKNLVPVLPEDILLIFEPIKVLDTVDYTIKHDFVMQNYSNNSLLSYIRLNRIYAHCGLPIDEEGMISRIRESTNIDKILYKVVCSIVKDECAIGIESKGIIELMEVVDV